MLQSVAMEKLKLLFQKIKDFVTNNKVYLVSIFTAMILLVVLVMAASKCEVAQQPTFTNHLYLRDAFVTEISVDASTLDSALFDR